MCHLYTLLYIIITKTEHALPIQEWVILILKGMHMTWDSLPTQVDASKHSFIILANTFREQTHQQRNDKYLQSIGLEGSESPIKVRRVSSETLRISLKI